jgi:hypothetical protein
VSQRLGIVGDDSRRMNVTYGNISNVVIGKRRNAYMFSKSK